MKRPKYGNYLQGCTYHGGQNNPKRCLGNEDNFWMHNVFIGVSSTKDLTKAVLSTIQPGSNLTLADLEKCGNDNGCFAMFTVNELGQAITDSYLLASYILGVEKLRQGKCLEQLSSLLEAERKSFNLRRHAVDLEYLKEENKKSTHSIQWSELQEEFARLLCMVGEQFENLNFQFLIKSFRMTRPKKAKSPSANVEVDFLNSFYLDDLDRLIAQSEKETPFGKAFELYMSDELPQDSRIDILQDNNAFSALLDPKKIPTGRWPISSDKHLMLAQQAAVYEVSNRLSNAHGIIGVNGPPGTGKTTLLRDIIADIIVQRAENIAKLNKPLSIFSNEHSSVNGRRIYPLLQEIVGSSGIVVTSNNNSAVENITKELPDSENISPEFNDASYFSELATKIHSDRSGKSKAWGLIAAVLGNASNKRNFMRHFFQEDSWWDLYFFDNLDNCSPEKFNNNSIILTGTFPNLTAHLIQDKKFVKDKNDHRIAVMTTIINLNKSSLLHDEKNKIIFTEDNKIQLNKIISQIVANAVLLFEKSNTNKDKSTSIHQINTLKQILEECTMEPQYWEGKWQQAKGYFLEKLAEFESSRDQLLSYKAKIEQYKKISHEIIQAENNSEQAQTILEQFKYNYEQEIKTLIHEQKNLENDLSNAAETKQQNEAEAIASSEYLRLSEQNDCPRVWERLLNDWFGKRTQRYNRWSNKTNEARLSNASAHEKLSSAILDWKQKKEKLNKLCQTISSLQTEQGKKLKEKKKLVKECLRKTKQLQSKYSAVEDELSEIRSKIQIPDVRFWQQPATEFHLSTVWLNTQIDHLRSQIFLAAMTLHEMTIRAGAKYFIANMRAVKAMLLEETKEPLNAKLTSILWNAFFFVVPVISTSLASFSRLFQLKGQESIGWLLIDEAGQATPQSIAGAIWRAQRAIIIGDPIQIEPIVTIPGGLVSRLQKAHDLDPKWSPLYQSAQTLADRITPLGTWMGAKNSDIQTWAGMPLRAHRRCASPMFDIANQIAYSGQMVQANTSTPQINTILGESAWFDVPSIYSDGQVVAEEIELFSDLLKQLNVEWPLIGEKAATIYAISPFNKVAKKCRAVISMRGLTKGERKIDCGTIHRFQGKEADIVFFILGSAPGKAGDGSRSWASQKPNLLNVALTRAKSRIYVIGNKTEWQLYANFNLLADTLPTVSLDSYLPRISLHQEAWLL